MSLCKRIIGVIMIENGMVVRRVLGKTKSIIGKPEITIQFLTNWDIDEVIFINVGKKEDISHYLKQASASCFVPITVGGSISTIQEVDNYFRCGADKIVIGKNATKKFCESISQKYGNQAICISIDYDHKRKLSELNSWDIGCGEIILHDMLRDGLGNGLNLNILSIKSKYPTIAMGGVGNYQHIVEGLKLTDAVAVGNLFHFKEISAKKAKEMARENNIKIRTLESEG